MMLRKHLRVALLLILVLSVFRGHTLTCRRSEYLIGDQCCPMCSAGSRVRKHCTEFRSTSCLDCDEGTYMDRPTGLTECFSCISCDAGSGLKIKTACTTISDTVCEPLEGFYCTYPSENGCVVAEKHSSCQPGQYISLKGTALKNAECSDCSKGTFSDGTFTSCQPHTQCESLNLQLIKAGNTSTDAECGEQGSGLSVGVVIGIVLGLVICLAALVIALFLKKKKDTGKRIPDNLQQYFKKNKHPPKEEEKLQGVAVVNEHRDRQPDTAEESSRFSEIQLDAGT